MILRPSPIYKYVSLDIAESIAITSTLKFTNPLKFNDPFDCDISRLKFDLTKASEEIVEEVKRLRQNHNNHPEITDSLLEGIYKNVQIDKIRRSSVCCFSCIDSNPLMWAHYANKHFGACLIFNNLIENKFPNIPDRRLTELLVEYNEFSQINYCESKLKGIKRLFGNKSVDWSYEKEYRLVILEQEGLIKFNPEILMGIIFGIKVNDEEIKRFKDNCKREKIEMKFNRAKQYQDQLVIMEA